MIKFYISFFGTMLVLFLFALRVSKMVHRTQPKFKNGDRIKYKTSFFGSVKCGKIVLLKDGFAHIMNNELSSIEKVQISKLTILTN